VAVRLLAGEQLVAEGVTDADGRCRLAEGATGAGAHRLVFATGPWFAEQGRDTFYPEVVLTFDVREPSEHHHVPLLLAPFAYSTYRGS
jgi:5-hydroxyisourate hydrolase